MRDPEERGVRGAGGAWVVKGKGFARDLHGACAPADRRLPFPVRERCPVIFHGSFMKSSRGTHRGLPAFAAMNEVIEDFAKYCMLALLLLPFGALAAEAAGKADGLMLKVGGGVVVASWVVVWLIGGFEKRPYVACVFGLVWVAWPLALLVAKGWNPRLSWASLWMSVLLMSWYHVSMAVLFEGKGGMGAGMGLFLGWAYMIGLFALLSLAFLAGRECVRIAVAVWPFGKDRGRGGMERGG